MTHSERIQWVARNFGKMLLVALAANLALAAAQAQTLAVLHNFADAGDGSYPYAGITIDRAGNLYGTTTGINPLGGNGTVFKMSHVGSGWTLNTIYTFYRPHDGSYPQARVVFGPDGTLYGTTTNGGEFNKGTVFNLRPPATVCRTVLCPWDETVIYSFNAAPDGVYPALGDLTFDSAGNIYGTTTAGGLHGDGAVFKLTRSGAGWTETLLYSFTGADDGNYPESGVTFDTAGNLYGTTYFGGSGAGVVYELSPAGSAWTETTLHIFAPQDGDYPVGGVAIDAHGNLYGTTLLGAIHAGTVWELSPSQGGWNFSILKSFAGLEGPSDTPTLDSAGNVYGTSMFTGQGEGEVFKLTPSGGGWTFTSSVFHGNDGSSPVGGVLLDANGNLYGTTVNGGTEGYGTVWEITP